MERTIVLFDGVCNLCNGLVNFLIRHDRHDRLRFGSLQSAEGKALLAAHGLADAVDSLVAIEGGKSWVESEAVLVVCRKLPFPWRLAAVLRLCPRRWRDALYRSIARRRYRWFGRRQACMVPTPEVQRKFITPPDQDVLR